MPAEFEPHSATWIAWPHNRRDWPGKYHAIPFVYAEMVRHLARVEAVHILVNDAAWEAKARRCLAAGDVALEQVFFHHFPTDRVWTRDSGPIFVEHQSGAFLLDWRFNAWAKYPNWQRDNAIPAQIARALGIPPVQPMASAGGGSVHMVLEGGSIEVNGRGTLITTKECLLSAVQQRNPGLEREQMEAAFAAYLGAGKVIWLERGILGDDTHGHVDDIARFVAPDTVVAACEADSHDPNHQPLEANLQRLRAATDQDGRPLRVVPIPMPAPLIFRRQRLPASYANFYLANGLVLVPTFDDANDRLALNILAELMPQRKVVGIYCGDLIWGLGGLHCLTQQQPR
jgi:agmatine deiminase